MFISTILYHHTKMLLNLSAKEGREGALKLKTGKECNVTVHQIFKYLQKVYDSVRKEIMYNRGTPCTLDHLPQIPLSPPPPPQITC
jgi:hypothetical protein